VLQIQRITLDAAGRPFEYQEAYFRGDRYVFSAELTEQAGERGPAPHRQGRRPAGRSREKKHGKS
jgi:hypothetical protein